jgi:hypothetical protein
MLKCKKCKLEQSLNNYHTNDSTCRKCKQSKCAICDKILSSKYKLQKHIDSVHNNIKPFKCEYCEFRCSQKSNLNNHKCYYQRNKIFSKGKPLNEDHFQKLLECKYNACSRTVGLGIVDIVTDVEIIEIKKWCNWKMAIGQIITYSYYYPKHNKRIHFFGEPIKQDNISELLKICKQNNIDVSYSPNAEDIIKYSIE